MKVTYTKTSNTHQEVEIELSSEEFGVHLNKAVNDLSKNLDVQGFRRGNAPRSIIEQKVGSAALYNEAADIAMQASYRGA